MDTRLPRCMHACMVRANQFLLLSNRLEAFTLASGEEVETTPQLALVTVDGRQASTHA